MGDVVPYSKWDMVGVGGAMTAWPERLPGIMAPREGLGLHKEDNSEGAATAGEQGVRGGRCSSGRAAGAAGGLHTGKGTAARARPGLPRMASLPSGYRRCYRMHCCEGRSTKPGGVYRLPVTEDPEQPTKTTCITLVQGPMLVCVCAGAASIAPPWVNSGQLLGSTQSQYRRPPSPACVTPYQYYNHTLHAPQLIKVSSVRTPILPQGHPP